jgi:hypothetical protein
MNFDNCYPSIAKNINLKLNQSFDVLNIHFGKTGVVTFENHEIILNNNTPSNKLLVVLYFDAEPMDLLMINEVSEKLSKFLSSNRKGQKDYAESYYVIATSDSNTKHIQDYIDNFKYYQITNSRTFVNTWYYFLHGFIALDWFREYEFYNVDTIIANKNFKYDYITMNRLVNGARNYRLCLMSRLEEKDLTSNALVSYSTFTDAATFEHTHLLPINELHRVEKFCGTTKRFDLEGDIIPNDSMHINVDAHLNSFLHLVTETCYYQKFNHLTEKVFKPIVMMQPFILAGTVESLCYLKQYGFKTFGNWIDESYDKIADPFKRLDAITHEVEKICVLSQSEQQAMFKEMLPTLIHNRQHFYGKFYSVLHKEMWENFRLALPQT